MKIDRTPTPNGAKQVYRRPSAYSAAPMYTARPAPRRTPPPPPPRRRGHWRLVGWLLLAAGLFCLAQAGSFWGRALQSDALYTELSAQVSTAKGSETAFDFAPLLAQNADTVGWLELEGLSLSLPITQGADNDTYLHRDFSGRPSSVGCLFLAAENDRGWADLHSVVFGHNLNSGAMFGRLTEYADPEFYAQHPVFVLHTPSGSFQARIFSCHAAQDGDESYAIGWQSGADYDAFLTELCQRSAYATGVVPVSGSRLLTLSTCASPYASNADRFVIHATLEALPAIPEQP